MPTQIIPITDIASAGVIQDTPSFALPPNAFSDVQNVRFRDGAVRKMTGENIFLNAARMDGELVYLAYWPSPSGERYVAVDKVNDDGTNFHYEVRIFNRGSTTPLTTERIITSTPATPNFQHTLFNGGFSFIINSTISTPYFINDDLIIEALPGWDSYTVEESVSDFTYDGSSRDVIIEDPLFVEGSSIRITVTPRNPSAPIRTTTFGIDTDGNLTPDGTVVDLGTASLAGTVLTLTPAPVNGGANVRVTTSTEPITSVTAGVIRAYGNLLVAGNLRENGPGSRTLTGTIRTSDVAAPGEIPRGWNPFRIGANTADEFTLSTTGTIQDLVELQGVLYIYTDSSIHAIQQTGNPLLPFQVTPVTDSYGADNTGSVLEVDGKHIVVGSNDVYVYSGHPGSIQSIADQRVRHRTLFRPEANTYAADQGIRIIRFNAYDELWFWRPRVAEMYIWNYRDNTWTRRLQSTPKEGNMGINSPIFIANNDQDEAYETDSTTYTLADNSRYEAYVERLKMALAPEFDTEMLASVAFLVSGNGQLNVQVVGSNNTGGTPPDFTTTSTRFKGGLFDIDTEYKQDIREHGRFLNYRMTHVPSAPDMGFDLTGFQLDIGKGGTR